MTAFVQNTRRRRGALLATSMLSTAALAAGALLAPGQAEAAACTFVGTSLYCNGPVAANSANGFNVVDLGAPPPNGTGVPLTATGTQSFTNTGIGAGLTVTLENNGSTINTTTGDGLDLVTDHAAILNDNGVITATNGDGVSIQTTTSTGLIGANINASVTGQINGVNANAAGAADVIVSLGGTGTTIQATGLGGAGVSASSAGHGVLVDAGDTTGVISGDVGIKAVSTGGGIQNVTVWSNEQQVIGARGDAIQATTDGSGTVAVGYDAGASTPNRITGTVTALAGGDGIDARNTGTGDVLVYTGQADISGAAGNGFGINATTAGATANVTVDALNSTITGNLAGIHAIAQGAGSVTVNSTISPGVHTGPLGAILGINGDGIDAQTSTGTINIGSAANPILTGPSLSTGITGAGGDGILARTTGGGNINATTSFGLITGQTGNGIWLDGESGGNLTLNASNTNFVGATSGINATTIGAGTITITGSNITAQGGTGNGIGATAQDGDITIGTSTNRITTGMGAGGDIESSGGGGLIAVALGHGSVSVFTGAGGFTSGATVPGGDAIGLMGVDGPLTADLNGSSAHGGYDGVFANATGNGTISITALDSSIAGDGNRGIDASTTGPTAGVTVNITDGIVNGDINGIYANAAGSGTVTVLDTVTPAIHAAGSVGTVGASNGDAIFAHSDTGTVNIGTAVNPIVSIDNATFGITGVAGNGIAATTTTGGAINLYTGTGLVTGTGGDAVLLEGGTGANVIVSAVGTDFNGSAAGIRADTSGAGTITINSTGGAVAGGTDAGILAVGQNGDVNIGSGADRITTGASVSNGIGSTSGDAIRAATIGSGSVNIFTGAGLYQSNVTTIGTGAISAQGLGSGSATVDLSGSVVTGGGDTVIAFTSGAGTATVNADGAVISGAGRHGINATTNGAASDVTVSALDTSTGGATAGIYAQTMGAGTVTVLNSISPGAHIAGFTGGSIQASNGDGIFAGSGTGTVNVGTALNPIITGVTTTLGITGTGGNGISATTATGGAINLYTGGGLITGVDGEGAFLDGGVGAIVTVNAVNTSFNGADSGILADTDGAGTVTINSTGGAVTGGTGPGINAGSTDGDINIGSSTSRITTGVTATTGVYSATSDAIAAEAIGAGGVNIYTGAGLYRSDSTAANSAAILARTNGVGQITVDAAGSTLQGVDGVSALSNNGAATVNVSGGSVNATADGLAVGGGPVNVTVGAGELVSAGAHAIITASDVGGTTIQISGTAGSPTVVQGLGSPTVAVIDVSQISGAQTTIFNGPNSTIRSLTAGFGDLAFNASGTTGSVAIANTGLVEGVINLGGLTDAGATTALSSNTGFDNGLGGVWHTSGASTFGSGGAHGLDLLINIGTLTTGGPLTTFTFGTATSNTFTNSGLLRVGYSPLATPFAASLMINHLGAFNNSGTIDMSDGATTPDRSVTAAGATFTGSGASLVKQDAQLAGPGSTADTLNVGSTAGSTALQVHDVSAAFAGNTGPAGITLVTTSGANGATAFTLDPGSTGYHVLSGQGVLEKGLFFYALQNHPNASILVSALGPQAYEFSDLTSGAQQIWYATTPWQDRQADLRDEDMMGGRGAGFEPGLWLKAVGDWADRDQSVSPMPGFKFDTSYRQQTGGLVGGWDATRGDIAHGGEGLFGVSVGYLDSRLDFKQSATRDQYDGWTAGVYATYLNGQFFLDGHLKTDQLKLKVDSALPFNGSANANSWGGQVDTGLRLPLGGGVMLEPVGTLAYVKSQIGDFVVAGTTVKTADNDSFRGGLGLRLSGTLASDDHYTLKLAGEARVWDEFADGNRTTFISSGPPIDLADSIKGTFGELGASLNMLGKDGHSSGFFNTSVKFKGGYTDDKVAIGFRYQWGGDSAH